MTKKLCRFNPRPPDGDCVAMAAFSRHGHPSWACALCRQTMALDTILHHDTLNCNKGNDISLFIL